jgi:large subunit ribosomal protein L28
LFKVAIYGRIRRLSETGRHHLFRKEIYEMAKCAHCGKSTTFGHNVSFSKRATNRQFLPNLQKVTVIENGQKVQKLLCTKCIRTLAKTK